MAKSPLEALPPFILRSIGYHLACNDYRNLRFSCKKIKCALPETQVVGIHALLTSLKSNGTNAARKVKVLTESCTSTQDLEQLLQFIDRGDWIRLEWRRLYDTLKESIAVDKKLQWLEEFVQVEKDVDQDLSSCILQDLWTNHEDRRYMKMHKILLVIFHHHLLKLVEFLCSQDSFDVSFEDSLPFQTACEVGDVELAKRLLKNPKTNPAANGNYAFEAACASGNAKLVSLLLKEPRINPSARNQMALRVASKYGFEKIVWLLIQDHRIDPCLNENAALKLAKERGQKSIVNILKKARN